jgi:hypothetical protein
MSNFSFSSWLLQKSRGSVPPYSPTHIHETQFHHNALTERKVQEALTLFLMVTSAPTEMRYSMTAALFWVQAQCSGVRRICVVWR